MQEISRIYSEISNRYLTEEFFWADLGSFGAADAYLLPLTSLKGKCVCVEGRNDSTDASNTYKNNPYINAKIESIKTFISGEKTQRFFYESSEGGGSTFYPSQDIVSQHLEGRKDKPLIRKLVSCEALSTVLDQKDINCTFIKADLEGAEFESLKSIIEKTNGQRPLVLEVEINVGERGPFKSIGDGLAQYEDQGYRLLDLRKTYFYPKGHVFSEDTINKDPIFAPYFQGCLHQADLLLIDTNSLKEPESLSNNKLLSLVLILMLYRQFHLTARLLEMREEKWAYEVLNEIMPRIINEFKKISMENTASIWGYHPLFNWLKST